MSLTYQKWDPVGEVWENIDPSVEETGCGDELRVTVTAEACDLGKALREAAMNAPCESCGEFAYYPNVHTCSG